MMRTPEDSQKFVFILPREAEQGRGDRPKGGGGAPLSALPKSRESKFVCIPQFVCGSPT
jgi:hypothetical protein